MTAEMATVMGKNSNGRNASVCLAHAIADELRRMHPMGTQKAVARDLDCGLKLAESILSEHLSAPTLARIIGAYGAEWVAERVLEAAGMTFETVIENRVERAERAAAQAQERAREARSLHTKLQAARRSDPGGPGLQA